MVWVTHSKDQTPQTSAQAHKRLRQRSFTIDEKLGSGSDKRYRESNNTEDWNNTPSKKDVSELMYVFSPFLFYQDAKRGSTDAAAIKAQKT